MVVTLLTVPPFPCAVPDGVFDAWSWCVSDVLEWRRPTSDLLISDARIGAENPPGLAFVMREACAWLPSELARLHAFGYGLDEERALAPWAIDDATDLLYEKRKRPRDLFWLAASSLEALVWGLHDWAHFHNHGPFDQPAMTELQCDLVALAWLRANAPSIGLSRDRLDRIADDLANLSKTRFDGEGRASPFPSLFSTFLGDYPIR